MEKYDQSFIAAWTKAPTSLAERIIQKKPFKCKNKTLIRKGELRESCRDKTSMKTMKDIYS